MTRSSLAAVEASLAFMLINGAGLLMAGFPEVLSVNPGFDPRQVISAFEPAGEQVQAR